MAEPYREGKGWCVRGRHEGHDIYLSGHKTKGAVQKALNLRKVEIDAGRAPRYPGPECTTLAKALQTYALERLRFLKGAVQEAVRINNYLRYAGIELLEVKPLCGQSLADGGRKQELKSVYFCVSLKPHSTDRKIPTGLAAHRKAQLTKNAGTEKHRAVLASTRLSDITRSDVQGLIDAMRDDDNAAATVWLERSMLRVLFNHARKSWRWLERAENPATDLRMPKVDNIRKRTMSADEQNSMDLALDACRNKLVAPTVALLRETAMRASEPLAHAKWKDVDWDRCILTLSDSKSGGREVPLSPGAIEALKQLGLGGPDEPLVRITYEALRGAWNDALKRADVQDLHLHDLRRTAATRMALKTGNIFLVQALTGHQTIVMAERYMNVLADDVVAVLHAKTDPVPSNVNLPDFIAGGPAAARAKGTVTLTIEQLQELMSRCAPAVQTDARETVASTLDLSPRGAEASSETLGGRGGNVVPFRSRAAIDVGNRERSRVPECR